MQMFGIDLPVIQAPMAGAGGAQHAAAVAQVGELGSIPGAMLTPDQLRNRSGIFRQRSARALDVNFFCHDAPAPDPEREAARQRRLAPCCREHGLDPEAALEAGPSAKRP